MDLIGLAPEHPAYPAYPALPRETIANKDTTMTNPDKLEVIWAADCLLPDPEERADRAGCVITRDECPSVDLLYGGYPYEITLDRIKTPQHVLAWVHHLSEKTWMTPNRIAIFIERCAKANRWPANWMRTP